MIVNYKANIACSKSKPISTEYFVYFLIAHINLMR